MADDASKWAAEFCRALNASDHALDENWVAGWFANAIEFSYDLRQRAMTRAYERAAAYGRSTVVNPLLSAGSASAGSAYGRSPGDAAPEDMKALNALPENVRAEAAAAVVRARSE